MASLNISTPPAQTRRYHSVSPPQRKAEGLKRGHFMRRNKETYGERTGEESACAHVRAGVWKGECESRRICIYCRCEQVQKHRVRCQ